MRKNVTLKKFANLRTKPAPLKKGITVSIEKVNDSNNYIAKKYVNGKLFQQKIVSDKKLKHLVQKQMKKMKNMKNKTAKRGGETRAAEPVGNNQVIQVEDKTSFWQTLKQGFGFGAGWAIGEGLVDSLFD